jgi:hypothetical protein|tara:strand:- start:434 stop:718 length:285 start_codon:yes stop_codon:yes gene_type:complete
MIFVAHRDFEPHGNYHNYCLGRMIHDDGDVIKWDWTIYKAVREEDFTEDLISYRSFEEICGLDVSPYERDMSKIRELFEEKCLTLLSEHGIVYT